MRGAYDWVRIGSLAGMLALPLTVLAIALLFQQPELDLRAGLFPWTAAAVTVLVLMCLNALRHYHAGSAIRLLTVAVALTFIGLVGMFTIFAGFAVSVAFRINETPVLLFGVLIVGIMTVVGLPVGLGLLGIALLRQQLLPRRIRGVPLVLAALIPGGMVAFGFADGTAEAIILTGWFVGFALGWAVLGYTLWKTSPASRRSEQR